MPEPELFLTTTEVAEIFGYRSNGTARKTLHRLGVRSVARASGRGGQNLYHASEVRAAIARMPGRGRQAKREEPAG